MKFNLAKLMQERLSEIDRIKKKAFSESSDHTLYLIKNVIINIKLKKSLSMYVVFKSFRDLEEYVNNAYHNWGGMNIEFIGIGDPSREEDILKIKDFVNCSEGETIKLIEYGGEKRFFMNEDSSSGGKLKILIFGPTEIVKAHGPIVC